MFGHLNRRNKARVQVRVITTTLSYQQVVDLAYQTAEAIPPKRTLTGKRGHGHYIHKRTKRPTIGFGHIDKNGNFGLATWGIAISPAGDQTRMQVLHWARRGGDIDDGTEIDRFYERFQDSLVDADSSGTLVVAG